MSIVSEALRSWLVECSCFRWVCWQHWRSWFMPLVVGLYCVVLLVVLPLLVWELYREGTPDEFKAWFVAGIFMLLTIPVFLVGLVQHLLNYTQPHLQKHIIRCTDISLSFPEWSLVVHSHIHMSQNHLL